MPAFDQDFDLQAGDSAILEIQVLDETGAPYPIEPTDVIEWWLAKTARSTARLISKTGAAIRRAAQAHKFYVDLAPADTDGLFGVFQHRSRITDATGKVRVTVTIGTARLGPA